MYHAATTPPSKEPTDYDDLILLFDETKFWAETQYESDLEEWDMIYNSWSVEDTIKGTPHVDTDPNLEDIACLKHNMEKNKTAIEAILTLHQSEHLYEYGCDYDDEYGRLSPNTKRNKKQKTYDSSFDSENTAAYPFQVPQNDNYNETKEQKTDDTSVDGENTDTYLSHESQINNDTEIEKNDVDNKASEDDPEISDSYILTALDSEVHTPSSMTRSVCKKTIHDVLVESKLGDTTFLSEPRENGVSWLVNVVVCMVKENFIPSAFIQTANWQIKVVDIMYFVKTVLVYAHSAAMINGSSVASHMHTRTTIQTVMTCINYHAVTPVDIYQPSVSFYLALNKALDTMYYMVCDSCVALYPDGWIDLVYCWDYVDKHSKTY